MLTVQYSWLFYVTLAYGVVMVVLAGYVITVILQDKRLEKRQKDEQE